MTEVTENNDDNTEKLFWEVNVEMSPDDPQWYYHAKLPSGSRDITPETILVMVSHQEHQRISYIQYASGNTAKENYRKGCIITPVFF